VANVVTTQLRVEIKSKSVKRTYSVLTIARITTVARITIITLLAYAGIIIITLPTVCSGTHCVRYIQPHINIVYYDIRDSRQYSVVRHGTIHSSRVLLNAHFEFDVDMSANSIQDLKSAWTPFFRPL